MIKNYVSYRPRGNDKIAWYIENAASAKVAWGCCRWSVVLNLSECDRCLHTQCTLN